MKKHLISMIAFVLEQHEQCVSSTNSTYKYANFFSKPLEIWQFVPCKLVDGVWVVLEEPRKHFGVNYTPREETHTYFLEYQEAKDRCYFEGFELARSVKAVVIVSNGIPIHFCSETKNIKCEKENYTIEDLFRRNNSLGYNLELTPTGQKESGLI